MKHIQRATLIDILIWIVILTQIIFLGSFVYTLHTLQDLVRYIASTSVSSDISSVSISDSIYEMRRNYEESMRVLRIKVDNAIAISLVEIDEPLEGRDLYISYIYKICEGYSNVDPRIYASLVEHESHFNASAKNYNGTCIGLSQLSTKWHTKRAKSLGVTDLWDPYGNLLTGIDYFSDLMESANGDPELAIMLYHMRADDAWEMHKSGKTDPYAKHVIQMAKEVSDYA